LANRGCGVVVLHHTGKGETSRDFRGASTIKDSVDVCYNVKNNSGNMWLDYLNLKCFKQRVGVDVNIALHHKLGVGFTAVDTAEQRQEDEVDSFAERLRDAVSSNPGVSQTGQEKRLHPEIPRDVVRRFIQRGLESGALVQVGTGKRTGYKVRAGDDLPF